jgi:hypothetical protein
VNHFNNGEVIAKAEEMSKILMHDKDPELE